MLAAMPFLPEGGHYQTVEALFYAVLLVCLLVAMWLGGTRSIGPLLCLAGILTLLIPITDMARSLTSGSVLHPGLESVTLLYGIALMVLALKKRPRQIMGAALTV